MQGFGEVRCFNFRWAQHLLLGPAGNGEADRCGTGIVPLRLGQQFGGASDQSLWINGTDGMREFMVA